MFIRLAPFLLVASTASSLLFRGVAASGAGSSEPLADLDRANSLLSQGKFSDAISLYGSVIRIYRTTCGLELTFEEKDKKNYLSYYKRALSYLGLHRYHAALSDLNAVLEIQPDFSAALVQRGKLFAWQGDYVNAINDLKKARQDHELIGEYKEAHKAVKNAETAEKRGDYQQCIDSASSALGIGTGSASLWQLRARCSLAIGDSDGAMGDLTQASKLVSTPEINILLSNLLFYSLNDVTSALTTIKKCLHQDPENKACKKEFRMLKKASKHISNLQSFADRKEWNQILTVLINENLLQEVQSSHTTLKAEKILNAKCPARLLAQLEEWTCQAYAGTKSAKLARQHCSKALELNPESIPALLANSQILLTDEEYEAAIRLLTKANEVMGGNNREIRQQLDKAQRLLRQSKKRDYYKILGVPRDADAKAIKKAYREMSKKYHPDKYRGDLDADAVSRKMAEINSAYEVLSNEELRTRYDNGDDPNDHGDQQGQPGHPFVFQQNGQNFFFQQGQNPFQGGKFKFHFGF